MKLEGANRKRNVILALSAALLFGLFGCSPIENNNSSEKSISNKNNNEECSGFGDPIVLTFHYVRLIEDAETGERKYVIPERYYDDESLPEKRNPLLEPARLLTHIGHVMNQQEIDTVRVFVCFNSPCRPPKGATGRPDDKGPSLDELISYPLLGLDADSEYMRPGFIIDGSLTDFYLHESDIAALTGGSTNEQTS